ncbi:MAG: rhomboid family intramembrane serine protease [Acidimicrobiia bacterium]|nr:rhomboid family intramembrane serine protease [Acidimicrobiia bacterium]
MVIPLRDDNPTSRLPLVTVLLIAANLVVFAFLQPHDSPREETRFFVEHAAIPCELRQGTPITAVEFNTGRCDADAAREVGSVQPYPDKNVFLAGLVSMFLHGSWFHVLGNMLFLWIFGNNVEDRFGPVGFAVFYVGAGAVALLAHVLADAGSTVPVVGASGAVAGVMGAYLVFWPHARVLTIVPLLLFVLVYLPASVVLLLWFGLQFLTSPNSGVAWVAHVGGFLLGAAVALVLRPWFGPPPRPRAVPPPRGPWDRPGPWDRDDRWDPWSR